MLRSCQENLDEIQTTGDDMMTSLPAIAAQFLICSALILATGVRLSRYGDIIAEKTGLGGTWIGVILMATVTSVPELVTGASSVLLFGTRHHRGLCAHPRDARIPRLTMDGRRVRRRRSPQ